MTLAGLVLAGGESTRMPGDKAFADFGGMPLVAWPLAMLRGACAPVAINPPAERADIFAVLNAPLVFDDERFAGAGPLAGVLAGLMWAAALTPRVDGLITAPCDAPFLPDNLPSRLIGAAAEANAPAAAARADRLHPLCAFWRLSLIAPIVRAFEAAPGGLAAHRFLKDIGAAEAVFDDGRAFANVNTEADLAQARERARALRDKT